MSGFALRAEVPSVKSGQENRQFAGDRPFRAGLESKRQGACHSQFKCELGHNQYPQIGIPSWRGWEYGSGGAVEQELPRAGTYRYSMPFDADRRRFALCEGNNSQI